jgi:hypothetical protein
MFKFLSVIQHTCQPKSGNYACALSEPYDKPRFFLPQSRRRFAEVMNDLPGRIRTLRSKEDVEIPGS